MQEAWGIQNTAGIIRVYPCYVDSRAAWFSFQCEAHSRISLDEFIALHAKEGYRAVRVHILTDEEMDEMRQDKERLDWLDENRRAVFTCDCDGQTSILNRPESPIYAASIREAIDKAKEPK